MFYRLDKSVFFLGVLFSGCMIKEGKTSKSEGFLKRISKGGTEMIVEAIPTKNEDEDALLFHVKLNLTKDKWQNERSFNDLFYQNLDSSFYLAGKQDTLWPLYVFPVANGQPLNPIYIAAFSKSLLPAPNATFHSNIKGIEVSGPSDLVFNIKTLTGNQ